MKNKKQMKFLQAAAVGSIVASILIAILTITGEEWSPLKDWLKNTFTHHWLGKGALSIAVFTLVTLWQARVCSGEKVTQAVWYAAIVAILSSVVMTVYFILHTLGIV